MAVARYVERETYKGKEYAFRKVIRVTRRTIDKTGQGLLHPEVEVEGWWTELDLDDEKVIQLYEGHALCEQFHSELFGSAESFASLRTATAWRPAPFGLVKTNLEVERLPSGKFDPMRW
ncbi:MAG: hypothetical protein K6360_06450 [Deltaproteobacteria bacterium]